MEEDLVKRAGIPFRSVPAAGVHGVGLRALPGNLAKLTRGVLESPHSQRLQTRCALLYRRVCCRSHGACRARPSHRFVCAGY